MIGGYKKIVYNEDQRLDLIECLHTEPSKVWHVLNVESELFLRLNAPAIAISNEEIAVIGGDDFEREPLKNGYIFNIKKQQVEEILTDNQEIEVCTYSLPQWTGCNSFVFLSSAGTGHELI